MIVPVDALFRRERATFALRLYCEDCALFDDALGECAHGYPTQAHRRPASEEAETAITFCKDFEVA